MRDASHRLALWHEESSKLLSLCMMKTACSDIGTSLGFFFFFLFLGDQFIFCLLIDDFDFIFVEHDEGFIYLFGRQHFGR